MAWLTEELEELTKIVHEVNTNLNDQIAELERRVDELESGANDRRKTRSMTDEQRKAAGERLQMGRAKKLGLDSIEQLHALHLRPGQKPTKAQVTKVKKEFPAK
jgi:TolA-binding protein